MQSRHPQLANFKFFGRPFPTQSRRSAMILRFPKPVSRDVLQATHKRHSLHISEWQHTRGKRTIGSRKYWHNQPQPDGQFSFASFSYLILHKNKIPNLIA
jgi:hypothetical protein